ncbi:hypothetical protein GOV10_06600 [Candidatus Woesearchaeota archaeon]|nr:hypothetical protein [Candidatus Woesearchaeota archaeon]
MEGNTTENKEIGFTYILCKEKDTTSYKIVLRNNYKETSETFMYFFLDEESIDKHFLIKKTWGLPRSRPEIVGVAHSLEEGVEQAYELACAAGEEIVKDPQIGCANILFYNSISGLRIFNREGEVYEDNDFCE